MDNQKHIRLDLTDRYPPGFRPRMHMVKKRDVEPVREDEGRPFKGNAMLPEIRFGLAGIPLKVHVSSPKIVFTTSTVRLWIKPLYTTESFSQKSTSFLT